MTIIGQFKHCIQRCLDSYRNSIRRRYYTPDISREALSGYARILDNELTSGQYQQRMNDFWRLHESAMRFSEAPSNLPFSPWNNEKFMEYLNTEGVNKPLEEQVQKAVELNVNPSLFFGPDWQTTEQGKAWLELKNNTNSDF